MIYTIGHSNHSFEALLGLLRRHDVTAVCDVRSQPYSRLHPQFGREPMRDALQAAGMAYVFLGKDLGGRSDDRGCYVDGQIQYDRLAKTAAFQRGLDRVLEGARRFRVALLCAEKDPLVCHRTLLVARHLAPRGVEVGHILSGGGLESGEEAETRLLVETGLPPGDMFRSRAEVLDEAYRKRAAEVAYKLTAAEDVSSAQAGGTR